MVVEGFRRGVKGRVIMLIGARLESALYYQKELIELTNKFPQFEIRYSVQNIAPELLATKGRETDIYATTKMLVPDFTNIKVFLCGGDSFVKKMKKQCFLAGANMGDIYSDTFLNFPK